MAHFFRAVSFGRWQPAFEYQSVTDETPCKPPIMADILGNVQTERNALSVYLTEDNPERNAACIVGLAALRDNLGPFDYIVFDRAIPSDPEIIVQRSEGTSLHPYANQMHYDLTNLTFYQLVGLVERVCCSQFILRRVRRPELAMQIDAALRAGEIDRDAVSPRLLGQVHNVLQGLKKS